MADRNVLAWRIEQTCLNAFPSLKQVLFGDWLMRFSASVSRRSNSVNPLHPECRDIAGALVAAESLYPAQNLPAIFRVPTITAPELDRALAARGYAREGETCVLHGAIGDLGAIDRDVRLLEAAGHEWLDAMTTLQGFSEAQSRTYRRIVTAIAIPARFAMLTVDGVPAALAYGAVHDRLLCYESVITAVARRQEGLARRVIAALAVWGRHSGAEEACLQVQADIAPAKALYAAFGLTTELYRYHYRRQPPTRLG